MTDERRDGPPPLHLGDYPHGAYWSAERDDAKRLPDIPDRPPWVIPTPRSAENPYPLRMFAETGADFALWGPLGEPPPTTNGVQNDHRLENVLPISASLRDRLLAWGSEYETFDLDGEDHDQRGYFLSRELKLELGDLYSVTYSLTFAGPHREMLHSRARHEPLPGWTLEA